MVGRILPVTFGAMIGSIAGIFIGAILGLKTIHYTDQGYFDGALLGAFWGPIVGSILALIIRNHVKRGTRSNQIKISTIVMISIGAFLGQISGVFIGSSLDFFGVILGPILGITLVMIILDLAKVEI